jgi:hypothetical protein
MVMEHLDSTTVLWAFGAVQALGLAAAWLSRVSEGSFLQSWSQWLFLLSLLLTGSATVIAPGFGAGYWLISSGTLGLMVVIAVCDFRHRERAFTV